MKKTLLFAASALMLLAGCQKNEMQSSAKEDIDALQTVTFTASISDNATKAAADNDGHAAQVNRCIMEVYFDGQLFDRQYAKVTDKKCSFTAKVASSRTYKVAFWADHVDHPDTQDGLKIDKYYKTNSTDGLKKVTLFSDEYYGNVDARDAFAYCGDFKVEQNGTTSDATLKRPFAQINVITTDVATVAKVETLKPKSVDVTIKNAYTEYNVVEATASEPKDLDYQAAIYNWDATKHNATLSMDYILASAEKSLINIAWKAEKDDATEEVVYDFNDIPYQRNYRTNIKGDLLTTLGKWNVTVDPNWDTPEIDQNVLIATDLQTAQNTMFDGTYSTFYIKDEAIENRDTDNDKDAEYIKGITGVDDPNAKGIEFDLSSQTVQTSNVTVVTLPKLPTENHWWIFKDDGTYQNGILSIYLSSNDPAKLILDVPQGTHVKIDGYDFSNIFAATGPNTLVISENTTVGNLNVTKGTLENHGKVTGTFKMSGNAKIREFKGLSQEDYETYKDCIDSPSYTGKYNSETGKWDIVKSDFVNETQAKGYSSITDAIAAAAEGDIINVLAEEVAFPAISKAGLTFKGNGETKITSFAGAAANTTIDGFNFTTSFGSSVENFTVKNSKFTGDGNAIRYAYNTGTFTVDDCEFLQKGQYGIHFDGSKGDIKIKNSKITGSVAIGTSIESIDFTDCEFAGKGNCGKCNINIYNKATFTGCVFSMDYTTGASRGILMLGGDENNTRIKVDNCSLTDDGTFTDIFRQDYVEGIASIDAVCNDKEQYTNGTFVGRDLSSIEENVAPGLRLNKLQDNVYMIGDNSVVTIGDKEYFTYEEAFAAAKSGDEIFVKNNGKNVEFTLPTTMASDITIKGDDGDYLKKIVIPENANITNLTVKNFDPTLTQTGFSYGFIEVKASATVTNLKLESCNISGPGSKNGCAVRFEASENAPAKTIEFKDCEISGFRYAFYASGNFGSSKVKFTNVDFSNMFSWCFLTNANNLAGVYFDGCTFDIANLQDIAKRSNPATADDFEFTFTNNSFTGSTKEPVFTIKVKPTKAIISGNKLNDKDYTPNIEYYEE